ncbi:probable serine/threonine-protein kinase PBL7 isoform X2 [Papaver somniferum]|uniref:probable serine/threonine-protein kinase PBL7 isoform X2 n=1 Tax=Papaver somniferum TaxID=3469 RepID=UPI000E7006A2|nr:probable serine/threonine-protein kinase PBL7 isoform X2 [Papaver somniferum]
MLIVYEFMPRGSLDVHLRDSKTAEGLAKAILYLHDKQLIHGDLKSSNVLLDEDLRPKLSDFGTTVVAPTVVHNLIATYGFADPMFLRSGELTNKTDVYSFGVIMLELISGHTAIDDLLVDGIVRERHSIVLWARRIIEERQFVELADPHMPDSPGAGFIEILEFVHRCVRVDPDERPSITDAVALLTQFSQSLKTPGAGPSTSSINEISEEGK